jgi:signal transduction histidine kinase
MFRTRAAHIDKADFGTALSPEAAGNSVHNEGQDFPLVIATTAPTDRQITVAIGIVIVLTLAGVVIAPFASISVARVDAFIPVLQTVLSAVDFITAVLLFSQFSIQPQRSLLAAASAYLFSGSFALLQTLAFPGAYAPAGLIGDGLNTPAWMYVLWHTTFPAAILVYALSKESAVASIVPVRATRRAILITVFLVFALIAGLAWIVTAKAEYLPSFYNENIMLQTRLGNQINLALWAWASAALVVLLSRKRTILDLWLMVTLLVYMPNFLVAIIGSSVRFTIGWYAARFFVLVGSCMLLTVLLVETTFLYSRLANALVLQRRERNNRLLSVNAVTAVVAHELRTPLGAIALNASTALSQLRSNPPELEDMDAILVDIEAESHRAGAIISSIRKMANKTTERALTNVEDVARSALKLLRHDLQASEISVVIEYKGNLPEVNVDSTQLQQVIFNLVKNGMEAMSYAAPNARRLRLTTGFNAESISLSVEDSGPGIPAEDRERIFDPFFTTKSGGMGLGLAISYSVIEDHGGKLRLLKSDSEGSAFELTIPWDRTGNAGSFETK